MRNIVAAAKNRSVVRYSGSRAVANNPIVTMTTAMDNSRFSDIRPPGLRLAWFDRALHDIGERRAYCLDACLHLRQHDFHLLVHVETAHVSRNKVVGWHLRYVDQASVNHDRTDWHIALLAE
jgi:hypothetical protein